MASVFACVSVSLLKCVHWQITIYLQRIFCVVFFKIAFIRLNLCNLYDIRIKTLLKLSAFHFDGDKKIYLFLFNCSQPKLFWFLLRKNAFRKKMHFTKKIRSTKKNAHYFPMNHTVYYYLERSMNSLKIFLIAFIVFACSQRWRKQNDKLHEYLSRDPFSKII